MLILVGGAAGAQALTLAVSPVLTRTYSAADYGEWALFAVVVALLVPFASAFYELAIVRAASDEEASSLAVGCALICLTLSVVILAAFGAVSSFQAGRDLLHRLPFPSIWLALLPVSLLELVAFNVSLHWLNRQGAYSDIVQLRMMQSGLVGALQILLGFRIASADGLILGTILGQGVSLAWTGYRRAGDLRRIRSSVSFERLRAALKANADNPRFLLPGVFMDVLSTNAPVMLLGAYASTSVVGNFNLTRRVLDLPVTTISAAISQIFYKDYSAFHHKSAIRELRASVVKLWIGLALVGLVPTLIVEIWGPQLFALIFGPNWVPAGQISRILMPMFYVQFVVAATSTLPLIFEMQRLIFKFSALRVITRPGALLIGLQFDLYLALTLYAASEIVITIVSNVVVYARIRTATNAARSLAEDLDNATHGAV